MLGMSSTTGDTVTRGLITIVSLECVLANTVSHYEDATGLVGCLCNRCVNWKEKKNSVSPAVCLIPSCIN